MHKETQIKSFDIGFIDNGMFPKTPLPQIRLERIWMLGTRRVSIQDEWISNAAFMAFDSDSGAIFDFRECF
jgi:hypothetical protein